MHQWPRQLDGRNEGVHNTEVEESLVQKDVALEALICKLRRQERKQLMLYVVPCACVFLLWLGIRWDAHAFLSSVLADEWCKRKSVKCMMYWCMAMWYVCSSECSPSPWLSSSQSLPSSPFSPYNLYFLHIYVRHSTFSMQSAISVHALSSIKCQQPEPTVEIFPWKKLMELHPIHDSPRYPLISGNEIISRSMYNVPSSPPT